MPDADQSGDPARLPAGSVSAHELVLDAAALLHVHGQSTNMTLTAVDRLNRGLDTTGTLVPEWASLMLVPPHAEARLAAVSPTGINMRRVAAAMTVIDRAEDGPLEPSEVRSGLVAASREPSSNVLVFAAACAVGAGALSVIFGAHHPATTLVAAISAALGGLLRRALIRAGAGIIVQAFAAALLAGLVGVGAHHLDVDDALGLAVLCPAMVLVPGPHVLNGALDLLALRLTLGIARLSYAGLVLAAIGAGLILGLGAGGYSLATTSSAAGVPFWADVIAAGLASGSYPVFFSMPYRMIGWPVAVGMLAHAAHWCTITVFHVGLAPAALLSCFIAGVVLVPAAHHLRMPFAAIGFASVVAMVPGVYVFRMLAGLVALGPRSTPELLTSTIANGVLATLVVAGMAIGLAVPMHVYAVVAAAADGRRNARSS